MDLLKGRTPGELRRVQELIDLARREFGSTSAVEEEVLAAAVLGLPADLSSYTPGYVGQLTTAIKVESNQKCLGSPPPVDCRPIPAADLSARFLQWLIATPNLSSLIHYRGVDIRSARFKQQLNLENAVITCSLWLFGCHFDAGIDLRDAHAHSIGLQGSLIRPAYMRDDGSYALRADRAKVRGCLLLKNGFRTTGEVRLLGVTVDGNVECSNSIIENHGAIALVADGLSVAGTLFFDHAYFEGEVRLPDTAVSGSIYCGGTKLRNSGRMAFVADRIRVAGGVYLTDGYMAEGEVRFVGATIGGNVGIQNCRMHNETGVALNLDGTKINNSLIVRGMIEGCGYLDLSLCVAKCLNDPTILIGASPSQFALRLSGFQYDSISSSASLESTTRLKWLSNSVMHSGSDIPDPQPYRWLAEVMKKQGHESEARTVLRVCANRRIRPLARRARLQGANHPPLYMSMIGVIGLVACGLLMASARPVAAAWLLGFLNIGVAFCVVAGVLNKLQLVSGWLEWVRVIGSQWTYRLLVGHGYARWRAAGWAFAFVTTGAIVFGQNPNVTMQPAQAVALRAFEDPANNAWILKYPKFDPVIYSVDTLLPLVSFHQEDHWTPSGRGKWGWFVKNVYLPLHISAGWVIATLFVASFTRLMRQEG